MVEQCVDDAYAQRRVHGDDAVGAFAFRHCGDGQAGFVAVFDVQAAGIDYFRGDLRRPVAAGGQHDGFLHAKLAVLYGFVVE